MPAEEELFVRYYDALFGSKDYRGEIQFLTRAFSKYGRGQLRTITDVGCGTGGHSFALAAEGFSITGIDIDAGMIRTARARANGHADAPEFVVRDVAATSVAGGQDMIISMFNVVNYIDCPSYLVRFFSGIHTGLRDGGLYVFDCWNGVATVLDPPQNKSIAVDQGGLTIRGSLDPHYDALRNTANYEYNLVVDEEGETHRIHHRLKQVYWSVAAFESALREAGFSRVAIMPFLTLDGMASSKDYKLSVVCLA